MEKRSCRSAALFFFIENCAALTTFSDCLHKFFPTGQNDSMNYKANNHCFVFGIEIVQLNKGRVNSYEKKQKE